MYTEQEKFDKNICFLLSLLLSLPLFTNFFGSIAHSLGLETTVTTYGVYGIVFSFFLFKYRLNGKQFYFFIILTSLILGAVLINRAFFPRSVLYMNANKISLYLMMGSYYPVAYAIKDVKDWSHFFHSMRYVAFLTPFLCWISIEFLNLNEIINYMQISNTLLPAFLSGWYMARVQKKKIYYIPSVFSLYLQLLNGGRMSFASGLVFIALLEILELSKVRSRKDVIRVSILFIMVIVGVAAYESIFKGIISLMKFLDLDGTRTIQRIMNGTIFESAGRDYLYEHAAYEVRHLGLKMYGFFGDRIAFEKYGGILYVHNIFYELILSFGWILGGGAGLWLVIMQIKRFFFEKDYAGRLMSAFFFCMIFMRLLVSGSFILEGQFVLLVGALFRNHKRNHEEMIEEEKRLRNEQDKICASDIS